MCYLPLLQLLLLLLRWLLLLPQLLPSLLPRLQCLRSTGRLKLPSFRRPGRAWRVNHPSCQCIGWLIVFPIDMAYR